MPSRLPPVPSPWQEATGRPGFLLRAGLAPARGKQPLLCGHRAWAPSVQLPLQSRGTWRLPCTTCPCPWPCSAARGASCRSGRLRGSARAFCSSSVSSDISPGPILPAAQGSIASRTEGGGGHGVPSWICCVEPPRAGRTTTSSPQSPALHNSGSCPCRALPPPCAPHLPRIYLPRKIVGINALYRLSRPGFMDSSLAAAATPLRPLQGSAGRG